MALDNPGKPIAPDGLSDLLGFISISKLLVPSFGTTIDVTVAVGINTLMVSNSGGNKLLYVYVKPLLLGAANQRVLLSTQSSIPMNSRVIRADNAVLDDTELVLQPSESLYGVSFIAGTRIHVATLSVEPRWLHKYK